MTRFHVFKDNALIATTADKKAAVDLIRQYQSKETHFMLRAEFSIIEGTQEFIQYAKTNNRRA